MKYLIKKILKEETQGVDSFLSKISEKYPEFDEFKDKVEEFIDKSECQKIEFANFKMPVMGLALHDGVMINNMAISRGLPYLLFVIFHEVAHQYQFKKYGAEKMYECYQDETDIDSAADFMKKTELVADEFASKKIKQLAKMGYISSSFIPPKYYQNVPIQQIKMMVQGFRNQMRSQNISSPEKISELFYNLVKNKI